MTVASIGRKMAEQNNRATQYPMFAIQVDVKVQAPAEAANEWERKDPDYWDPDNMCEKCLKLHQRDEEVPEQCSECSDEEFWYYNIEQQLKVESAGVFFTAEACQKHIDENRYHYNNPKVYGIGSWRNPEMQAVQKHIIVKCAYKKLPNHYK